MKSRSKWQLTRLTFDSWREEDLLRNVLVRFANMELSCWKQDKIKYIYEEWKYNDDFNPNTMQRKLSGALTGRMKIVFETDGGRKHSIITEKVILMQHLRKAMTKFGEFVEILASRESDSNVQDMPGVPPQEERKP